MGLNGRLILISTTGLELKTCFQTRMCPNEAVSRCSGADLGKEARDAVGKDRACVRFVESAGTGRLSVASARAIPTFSSILEGHFYYSGPGWKRVHLFSFNNTVENCIHFRVESLCARLQLKKTCFP